jgi:hypothetical protein
VNVSHLTSYENKSLLAVNKITKEIRSKITARVIALSDEPAIICSYIA